MRIAHELAFNQEKHGTIESVKDSEELEKIENKCKAARPDFRSVIEYKKQDDRTREAINKAGEAYEIIHAPGMFIIDGSEAENKEIVSLIKSMDYMRPDIIEGIRCWVEQISGRLKAEGRRLDAVFVDYLQRVKTAKDNVTDKKEIDTVVSDLHNISKQYKLPVVLLSSINRQAAKENTLNQQSFMGSGGIEFTADYLLALSRCYAVDTKDRTQDEIKNIKDLSDAGDVVDVKLELLKNRTGKLGETKLIFHRKCGRFINGKN